MKLAQQTDRLVYLDNLRAVMVILVVIMHAAVTYSGFGSWYYIENKRVDDISALFFGLYQAFTQAYFMSLLFMLAGYLVPHAMLVHGTKQYILRRLFRLGVPILVYVFLIHPLVVSIGHPEVILADYYFNGIMSLEFVSWTGPLWFALVLLIFTLVFLLIKHLCSSREFTLNVDVSQKNILLTIMLITLAAFTVRTVYPIGTSVINLQFCYFAAYIVMFSVGIISYYTGIFEKIDYRRSKRWLIISLVVGIPFWLVLMLVAGPMEGNFLLVNGGFHWQSLAFSLWESFFCVTFIIGLMGVFKQYCNSQSTLQKFLAENSFGVYVFHALILTAIAVVFKGWGLPPVCKFLIVTPLAVVSSFIFSHIIRQSAFLRKIFS